MRKIGLSVFACLLAVAVMPTIATAEIKKQKAAPARITCDQWIKNCGGGHCNDPNRLVNASCKVRGNA